MRPQNKSAKKNVQAKMQEINKAIPELDFFSYISRISMRASGQSFKSKTKWKKSKTCGNKKRKKSNKVPEVAFVLHFDCFFFWTCLYCFCIFVALSRAKTFGVVCTFCAHVCLHMFEFEPTFAISRNKPDFTKMTVVWTLDVWVERTSPNMQSWQFVKSRSRKLIQCWQNP